MMFVPRLNRPYLTQCILQPRILKCTATAQDARSARTFATGGVIMVFGIHRSAANGSHGEHRKMGTLGSIELFKGCEFTKKSWLAGFKMSMVTLMLGDLGSQRTGLAGMAAVYWARSNKLRVLVKLTRRMLSPGLVLR